MKNYFRNKRINNWIRDNYNIYEKIFSYINNNYVDFDIDIYDSDGCYLFIHNKIVKRSFIITFSISIIWDVFVYINWKFKNKDHINNIKKRKKTKSVRAYYKSTPNKELNKFVYTLYKSWEIINVKKKSDMCLFINNKNEKNIWI